MKIENADIRFEPQTLNLFRVMVGLGLVTLVTGLFLAPERTWANLLLVSYGMVGLGLGGAILIAILYLSGAGWAVALRRVPEAMFMLFPVGAAGVIAVLLARPELYAWTNPTGDLEHFMLGFKGVWLDRPFFLARAAVYIIGWWFLARKLISNSRQQDQDGDPAHSVRNGRYSAVFAVFFGVTFCFASFDWIMSLEPMWFSTIFGFYNFVGTFVSALALFVLYSIWLRRRGDYQGVLNGEHLHDLGKLLMGFSTVWAYIWFSQFMLIWYSNLPEETGYYVMRREGSWNSLFLLNLVINWAAPFFILLPAQCKRSTSVMAKVAVLLLAGRWLDLYLMIMPTVLVTSGPRFGFWEIGLLVGVIGAIPLLMNKGLRAAPLIPLHDPRLQQSLEYHS